MSDSIFKGFSTIGVGPKDSDLSGLELVERDLLNHFHTRKGERVMYPTFGSIIWDLLFEPIDESTKGLIISDATAIVNSEPRVQLNGVHLTEHEYGVYLELSLLYKPNNAVRSFQVDFDRRSVEK